MVPVSAVTMQLHVVKYANDNTTVMNETMVNYTWMEANLPVFGDGSTHYYLQGPVFVDNPDPVIEEELRWNSSENTNEKDQGAVKGTNVKDLCDLVGGMNPGDTVVIRASDGFSKTFAYPNVYSYPERQGPMVITWEKDGYYPDTGYSDGMKLVFFADASVNPWGYHMMGNYDWHESADPEYWYYFMDGDERYPTTTGLSVKFVSDIKIFSQEAPPVPVDTIFGGTVTLSPDSTFNVTAYNSQTEYTVNSATPLGALNAASNAGTGFTYSVGDKNFGTKGILLLDEIDSYWYNKTAGLTWICQVNGVTLDDYGSPNTDGFNIKPLSDGDQVNFYFGPKPVSSDSATAVVKITVDIPPPGPVVDTIFDGTVTLSTDSTFNVTAYNSQTEYTVNSATPLGALNAASNAGTGFTYSVGDKNFGTKGILLLDEIGSHWYNKTAGLTWICQVNGVTLDDYGSPNTDGFNIKSLSDGDQVNFYFGPKPVSSDSATAVVKITVDISGTGPVEPDWELSLSGARDQAVTRTYFEQGLACASSGHLVTWTDSEGNVWGGVPLWLLVGMVDDNPDSGPDHFNFNDALAAKGYSIKVIAGDGYNVNFESADIARNNDYIVANSLNGTPLPILKPNSTKPCFPLQLIGPAVSSGKLIGNITTIELVGIPEPSEGWTLTMEGEIVDTITQAYFEEALTCIHTTTWTDGDGNVWSGIPLWVLAGAVDDIETSSHWTFNDTLASSGYTIRVMAGDGYNRTFSSSDVAHSGNYLVANVKNGQPLSGNEAPLRLVGTSATGGKSIGNIATIRLEGLPGYPEGDWDLLLEGAIRDTIPQPEFEYWASCHSATYTDGDGNVYEGVPLWRLMGWVDDRIPHGPNGFNNTLANAGYTVIVTAGDGYSKEFTSQEIGTTNGFIIANRMNGLPLPTDGSHPPYPLRLVGAGLPSVHYSVGNVEKIELTEFQEPTEIPQIHIIKYDADGVTIINETTVDHVWMEAHLPVVGDGVTHYMYQGVTLDPADLWDPTETKGMNPPKVDNAIKGTRVSDLCDLVGGMEPGTEITFVATDGWETTLPYDCIYTNPHVYSNLGDTIIAWYADGKYVPQYGDGPRLFFTPEDHVTGQWNMHEALAQQYWHYYWDAGVQYPSVAGLSAKYIATIRIYASPVTEWTLVLDGEALGGLNETITRNYFESALACQFGADHKAAYTDSQGRTWEGMPLWFLCGFVDDADQHSDHAYNETRALEGYRIIVTASDGYNYTFDSRDTFRNANYIVANTLNGSRIPEGDSSWPLRLVGQNVTGAKVVKGISSVVLIPSSVTPVTDFTATPLTGSAPLPVQFTDLSTGEPLNWAWDFQDDGTIDSTEQNPLFTYQVPGTYSVRLTVTKAGGSDSEVKGNYITVTAPPTPPVAVFTSDIQSGQAPLNVQFTDTSTGTVTSRFWDFGDGTTAWANATTVVTHVYSLPGTYTVVFTAGNGAGSSTSTKTDYIVVGQSGKPPVARFTLKPIIGYAPLTVSFSDRSTGAPQKWQWDFGDGSGSSEQNPSHMYTRAGRFIVTLTVYNSGGSDTYTSHAWVRSGKFVTPTVTPTPPSPWKDLPDAQFSQSARSGNAPLEVVFTDKSTQNPTSWLWDFGDQSSSAEQNPVHTYQNRGVYFVKLTVANDNGSDTRTGYVMVTRTFNPLPI
jgi:PKD repeat protein